METIDNVRETVPLIIHARTDVIRTRTSLTWLIGKLDTQRMHVEAVRTYLSVSRR